MEEVRRTLWERSAVFESVGAACELSLARLSSLRISLDLDMDGSGQGSRCAALESLFRQFHG